MKLKTMLLCIALSTGLCNCFAEPVRQLVKENFKFAEKQLTTALQAVEKAKAETPTKGGLNYISPVTINKDGSLRIAGYKDWTCGFFPGSLWYLYENTGKKKWMKQAKAFTEEMEPCQYNKGTHDLGFLMYCSYGNAYRLTGKPEYRDVLIQSARSLMTRFNPTVGCIRSWDHNADKWDFPVIIDNMMNLELLFWAAKTTGDKNFYNVAVSHANTTLKNHFRADYSTYHVVDYNPATGAAQKWQTHQGYADSSSWARGQAWGLYGFTLCYRETGDTKYLEQAKNIARFIFNNPNMTTDLIPYWDYDAPKTATTPRDASAAMVTASALYELSLYDKASAAQYVKWADTILENATAHYRSPLGKNYGFLLLHSTGNYPAHNDVDVPLNYADYYFLEALTRRARLNKGENIIE